MGPACPSDEPGLHALQTAKKPLDTAGLEECHTPACQAAYQEHPEAGQATVPLPALVSIPTLMFKVEVGHLAYSLSGVSTEGTGGLEEGCKNRIRKLRYKMLFCIFPKPQNYLEVQLELKALWADSHPIHPQNLSDTC